eukprot:CAMPEP_0185690408 /NCGR_PEP_ID=MMETSP1164-20130828/1097_1 /TAXON_ID=1104430 /ORGANISM="Chrysoreinhardia sp, Strain CCMP2950" /LENGTH=419 /DNA_ID=CAMNT_0028356973 /DNA_START=47 /DNA_END=1306 /DNA_ORIENTATION=+
MTMRDAGPVRFGVIGAGCIGKEHVRNLLIAPPDEAVLVACCDPDTAMLDEAKAIVEQASDTNNAVRFYASAPALLNDAAAVGLDAVIVAVPNHKHIDVCELVLDEAFDLHVLCEKPVVTTIDDCVRLARLVEDRRLGGWRKTFAVGLEYRHIPTMRRLLDELPAVGAPRMVAVREHRFPFLAKVGAWNRENAKSGGTLVEKGTHFFDLFRLATKGRKPTTVYAKGGQAVNHLATADVLDHAVVVADYDGVVCTLDLCMFAEASANQLEVSVVGDAGKLEAFAPAHGIKADDKTKPNFRKGLRDRDHAWEHAVEAPPVDVTRDAVVETHVDLDADLMAAGDHAGSTYYQLLEFAAACRKTPGSSGGPADKTATAGPNLASIYDAAMSVAVGVAAQLSIQQGRSVDVRDLVPDFLYHGRCE